MSALPDTHFMPCMDCPTQMDGIVCYTVRKRCIPCGCTSLGQSSAEALAGRRLERGEVSNVRTMQ